MKLARTGLIAALAVLISVPQAAAQQILKMPAPGQKPAFSFTKDVVTPAPIPRLELSPMFEVVERVQDPTGLLGLAAEDDAAGASKWWVGGLVLAGIGGWIAYNEMENEEPDDPAMMKASLVLMGSGVGLMLIGTIIHLDNAPQIWAGKTRGGVAAGLRIPIGRR